MTLTGPPSLVLSNRNIKTPGGFQIHATKTFAVEGEASPFEIDESRPYSEEPGSIRENSIDSPGIPQSPLTPATRKSLRPLHLNSSLINYIPTMYTRGKMYPGFQLSKSKLNLRANLNLHLTISPEKSLTRELFKSPDRSQSQTLVPSNLQSKPSIPTPGDPCTSPGLSCNDTHSKIKDPSVIHSLQSLDGLDDDKHSPDSRQPRSIVLGLSNKKQSLSRLPKHSGDHEMEVFLKRERVPQSAGHKPKNWPPTSTAQSLVFDGKRDSRKGKLTFIKVKRTSNAPRNPLEPLLENDHDSYEAEPQQKRKEPNPFQGPRHSTQIGPNAYSYVREAVRPLKLTELMKR